MNMSKRLQNCLLQNGIHSLSELTFYTRSQIKRFRKLGKAMLEELDHLCAMYEVNYYVLPDMPLHWQKKQSFGVLEKCFSTLQIQSLDVFKGMTSFELYRMLDEKYILTAILYGFLRTSQVFPTWEDSFLFEYLHLSLVKNIFWHTGIMKMSQLDELIHNKPFFIKERETILIHRALKKFNKEHNHAVS